MDAELFQVQYRDQTRDLYFIGNISTVKDTDQEIEFTALNGRAVCEWDVHTGSRKLCPVLAGNKVRLQLGPSESCLLVLEPATAGLPVKQYTRIKRDEPIRIAGPWETEWKHMNGTTTKRTLPDLIDPGKDPKLSTFAGEIVYRAGFNAADLNHNLLSPGKIRGTARVKLNGRDLGVQWFGRREFDLTPALKFGQNQLEISVITPMHNYWITLRKSAQRNTPEPIWCGMLGPVGLLQKQVDAQP